LLLKISLRAKKPKKRTQISQTHYWKNTERVADIIDSDESNLRMKKVFWGGQMV
jgi:hypothetical protein